MPELDARLTRLASHDGVEAMLVLGRDGLVIRQVVGDPAEGEGFAARIPAIVTSAEAMGRASGRGVPRTAIFELEQAAVIVLFLSPEIMLAVVLRAGVGFAHLLRELRSQRDSLLRTLLP